MSAADYGYTCVTCQLQFKSAALQREHFTKSDLHRYNAKRKVADLPPVTAEVFNEKISERRQQLAAGTEVRKLVCKACTKTFGSNNAYQDHLNSKKHKENVFKSVQNLSVDTLMGRTPASESESTTSPAPIAPIAAIDGATATEVLPLVVQIVDTEDSEATAAAESSSEPGPSSYKPVMPKLNANSCLFCTRTFATMEVNLKHMANNHAFHIPDLQYCRDLPGLLSQLGEEIAMGNICIQCGHGFGGFVTGQESDAELVKRANRGLQAVRAHMIDKSHCRIPWDTDDQRLVYSDHYDFTSTWEGVDGGSGDMDVDGAVNNDGWEDEDGSDIDENDEVIVDDSAVRRKTRSKEEDLLENRIRSGESDFELILPSGARIGHRALKGVYKANIMRKSCCDPSKPLAKSLVRPDCLRSHHFTTQHMWISTSLRTRLPA